MLPGERQTKPASRCLEHSNAFGHDLASDPVAFDYRYPIAFQISSQ
jgi:hypothetical protein